MDISFGGLNTTLNSTLVYPISEELSISAFLKKIDDDSKGTISHAMDLGSFKGKKNEALLVSLPQGSKLMAVLLVGFGKLKELEEKEALALGGSIYSHLYAHKIKRAQIYLEMPKIKINEDEAAANIASGISFKAYNFDKYKSVDKKNPKHEIKTIQVLTKAEKSAERLYKEYYASVNAVNFVKTLVSEPPNVIYPETLAKEMQKLEKLGIKVTVYGQKDLEKLNANAILGVARGSRREPKMVVMEYRGGKKGTEPVAFVGKGVTFDSGGISIKPSQGMEDMKYDMAGSAVVAGVMMNLAERKAKVNAVGIVALVENMPGGNAQRPSDIVVSMSGQTIEVLNTDAEGRLILADALWFCQREFKPKFIVDLATLTGAIVIALSNVYAGLFSNNDKLADGLFNSGIKTGEKVWRLPLADEYDRMIDAETADVANVNVNGKGAGSITAAQFLQRFVNKTPWAHLDIAGVAWDKKNSALHQKGATAFGVRLLNQWVKDYCEDK